MLNLLRDNGLLDAGGDRAVEGVPAAALVQLGLQRHAPNTSSSTSASSSTRGSASDLYRSGYRIYTTLDLDIQQAAERALEARLEAIESGADGKFEHPTYQQYQEREGRRERRAGPAPPRPISRGWW